jgi:predicted DNA-binding transcriptional regulator AlpA
MRVDEVKDVFQISRGAAYEAVKTGDIPSIRIGGRIVIPTSWVRRALQLDDQGSR